MYCNRRFADNIIAFCGIVDISFIKINYYKHPMPHRVEREKTN